MSRHAVSPGVEHGRRRSRGSAPASLSISSRPAGTSSSTGTRRGATESRSSVHRSTRSIPPIPEREYRDEVLAYLAGFRDRFDEDASARSQAYAILTMCRGFYSTTTGERLSKREAGLRARRDFPRWDALIERALSWRDRQWDPEQPDGSTSVAETRAFIDEMAGRLDLP